MATLDVRNLNSKAVRMLQHGDTDHARLILVEALLQLGAQLRTGSWRDVYALQKTSCAPCLIDVASLTPEKEKKDRFNREIYNGAFLLSNSETYTVHEISAVLLFNLGLIFHRTGIETGCSLSLQKALLFYRHSLSQLEVTTIHPPSVSLIVLVGALCQNKYHIHQTLVHIHEARCLIPRLAEVVSLLEHLRHDREEDLKFFRTSLFFASLNGFTYAPAA
jgi:hypothetical protein